MIDTWSKCYGKYEQLLSVWLNLMFDHKLLVNWLAKIER